MASTASTTLSLYRNLLRASRGFADYNIRMYALHRVRDAFKANKTVQDQARVQELIKQGNDSLALIKRQALISQLYSTDKLIIEEQGKK